MDGPHDREFGLVSSDTFAQKILQLGHQYGISHQMDPIHLLAIEKRSVPVDISRQFVSNKKVNKIRGIK
jgi:hypothetical protein